LQNYRCFPNQQKEEKKLLIIFFAGRVVLNDSLGVLGARPLWKVPPDIRAVELADTHNNELGIENPGMLNTCHTSDSRAGKEVSRQ